MKAGRSSAGSRAAASHTGALASSDAVVDALFRQAGVIRTERLEELFDVAALLAHQPVPRGARVAILTNAGGPGILAADACEANGLELPALSEATRAELRSFLPAAASVGNPVDMLASAPPDHYRRALDGHPARRVGRQRHRDLHSAAGDRARAVAAAIAEARAAAHGKPVLGVFMRAEGAPAALRRFPPTAFPESAALALARVTAYGRWRARPLSAPPVLDRIRPGRPSAGRRTGAGRGGGWTTPDEAAGAARRPPASRRAARASRRRRESAMSAAAALGYPVALKALGPTLLHKTERRAVCLNLLDEAGLGAAYADFATASATR